MSARRTADLWPADFPRVEERTPFAVIREQAALLGKKTRNLVRAEVTSGPVLDRTFDMPPAKSNPGKTAHKRNGTSSELNSACLEHRFELVAPALDNYTYELFTLMHRVESFYPLWLEHNEEAGEIKSEKQLVASLAQIFNLAATKRVIRTLIDQSQAA